MITTEVMSYVRRGTENKAITFSVGLSTDSKGELNPVNGSIFKEIDTGSVYIFDETNNEWRIQE